MSHARPSKPSKPYPEFPLYAHARGQWAKKISGKVHYFGKWESWRESLTLYQSFARANDLPVPPNPPKSLGTTSMVKVAYSVREACNLFLAAKKEAEEHGELSGRTWKEYYHTCTRLVEMFADRPVEELSPEDFADYRRHRAKTCNLIAIGNEITRVRTLFKWLREAKHIDALPDYGPTFKKPSAKSLRRERRINGKKLFTAEQIKSLMTESGTHLRAMIYLGINCGFGPTDIGLLPISAVDLKRGIIDYPRNKTEVPRIIPLWPETVRALKRSLKARYTPEEELGRFFVLPNGAHWDNCNAPVCKRFKTARQAAYITKGGFYWLRHTFATVASGAKDQIAVNAIMGHVDGHISSVYREEIEMSRLEAVVSHVRDWLLRTGTSVK